MTWCAGYGLTKDRIVASFLFLIRDPIVFNKRSCFFLALSSDCSSPKVFVERANLDALVKHGLFEIER